MLLPPATFSFSPITNSNKIIIITRMFACECCFAKFKDEDKTLKAIF